MFPRPDSEYEEWRNRFQRLQRFQPRAGYQERFWARAEAAAVSKRKSSAGWSFIPIAVAGGLLLGCGLGLLHTAGLRAPGTAAQEITALAGVPAGTLSAALALSENDPGRL